MRLTNKMREDFADAVMRKIPIVNKWTREKVLDEIAKRLLQSEPKEVQDFYKKYPSKVAMTSTNFRWLDVIRPDGVYVSGRVSHINDIDIATIDVGDLREFYREYLAEMSTRKEMRDRIIDQAFSCNTLDHLKTKFPDLTGLMPKEPVKVKSLPVPAKGLIDDLVKFGLEIPQ